ncbi:MAG: hypothetical protein D3904_05055, partial [Candidatus Electrothrix sp. EH2]|nr:hypothetical protein [Candidatus Electrothrix sp. EH2]
TLHRMPLLAHELTHTIQQGHSVQRSPQVTTTATTPLLQRLFGISLNPLDSLRNFFAKRAYLIPGFRLLTIIMGFNPINNQSVDRNAANILRAMIELIPGGNLITQALDNHGVFTKAGEWVEQQLATLGDIGSGIVDALKEFIRPGNLLGFGSLWERAKSIFTTPIRRIKSFAVGIARGIMQLVKDALLKPLAALAKGTKGYDLLCALLGEDPITSKPVPRNAETLIGGFMKLIGREDLWKNLKKANAVPRAWAWFQKTWVGLLAFAHSIPGRITATLDALTPQDILTIAGAFKKVVGTFAGIVGEFISWGLKQVVSLLEILFSVVAPSVMPYLKKAKGAFVTILKNPIGFAGNLVRAGKLGFQMFAGNILKHLKTALIKWITGPLGKAGVYIPKSFSLMEIIKLVLSVLGLTWQNIRQKLVKIIPDPILTGLEKTAGILVTLVKDGPVAAWEQIKNELAELKDQLISQVTEMVTTKVVQAAVTKLGTMLNPAGAVIQSIISIYNTITFFIERAGQMASVVGSFINSISAIAAGRVKNAATRVEQTMAKTLNVVLAFLANFAGLDNIPKKIVAIIQKIRKPIDKGMDKIVGWLGNMLKKGANLLKKKGLAAIQWWKAKKTIPSTNREKHHIYLDGNKNAPKLMVASSPMDAEKAIEIMKQNKASNDQINQAEQYKTTIDDAVKQLIVKNKALGINTTPGNKAVQHKVIKEQNKIMRKAMRELAELFGKTVFGQVKYDDLQDTIIKPDSGPGKADKIEAAPLTAKRKMGSRPTAYPVGWKAIVEEGLTNKAPYYVRLHLINENFGGKGNYTKNLVPGSKQNNSDHLHTIENQLKKLIGNKPNEKDKLAQVWYKAEVNYRDDSEKVWEDSRHKNVKASYFAKSINFTWGRYKHENKEWKKDGTVIGNFRLGPIPLPKLDNDK